ncbi:MAG TPA: HlyD family efflux transporter periplasmic adaptor subunit [Kofleriaceae bacterium]
MRVLLVVLVLLGVGGIVAWSTIARVPIVKVSAQARIEPHNAVFRIEPPSAGRVVRSMLNLDEDIKEGDLLIEFDTHAEQLELDQSKATLEGLKEELTVISEQIANKKGEAHATGQVDEVAVKEAMEREQEIAPRHKLAQERAELALKSPTGSMSEIEKLERRTDVDSLGYAKEAQSLAIIRLRREQSVRGQTMIAQLLSLQREQLKAESQIRELQVAISRLEYQIERKHYRAPASGHLVDVAELGAGAFIADGQRVGTIVSNDAEVRIRARFPKEVVGQIQPGQTAQLKLDGYPWTIYGTDPAKVTRVGTEPGLVATPEAIPDTVRVELDIEAPPDSRIQLHHGMTATVEVEVARVSPIALLMRSIGEWHTEPQNTDDQKTKAFQSEAEAR